MTEELLDKIINNRGTESIKSTSQTNLNQKQNANVLLQVPEMNGKRDMLYSTEFYKYLEELSFVPAAIRIANDIKMGTHMFLATSGSGKTATCIEICRRKKTLFFDCFQDYDFQFILKKMDAFAAGLNSIQGRDLEQYCNNAYLIMLQVRYRLLERLVGKEELEKKPMKWYSFQRTESFQSECVLILELIYLEFSSDFDHIQKRISVDAIILDEANHLLDILDNRFSNSLLKANTRSLFSFIVRTNAVKSIGDFRIYAGTHIKMKDESLIKSGAGGGKPDIIVHAKFDFYDLNTINSLLQKSLTQDAYQLLCDNEDILNRCCFILQGRVRFFSSFLMSLAANMSSEPFLDVFETTLDVYIKNMTFDAGANDKTCLYSFWKKHSVNRSVINDFKLNENTEALQSVNVFNCLLELLLNHLIDDPKDSKSLTANVDLVDTALTRLIKNENETQYTYKICEPLAAEAGLNFLKSLGTDYLSNIIIVQMRAVCCTPQNFGKLFEFLLAVRSLGGWWKTISLETWKSLTEINTAKKIHEILKELEPPSRIYIQTKNVENGINMSYANFINFKLKYFILPNDKFGPDGLYRNIVFNLKTSQDKYVSAEECAKNFSKTDVKIWGAKGKNVLHAIQKHHLLYFQLEFPDSNPENAHRKIESDETKTIIPVTLSSPIAVSIFGKDFVEEWTKKLTNEKKKAKKKNQKKRKQHNA